MWVGKADAQTLGRWTPLQSSDRVTGGGNRRSSRLEDPTSLWHRPQSHVRSPRTITIPFLADKSEKLHTRSQRMQGRWWGGWRGGEWRKKEGRGKRSRGSSSEGDACMQNQLGSDIKLAVRNCSQALTTVWLIVSLAKAQLAPQRWSQTLKPGGPVTPVSDVPHGIQVGKEILADWKIQPQLYLTSCQEMR